MDPRHNGHIKANREERRAIINSLKKADRFIVIREGGEEISIVGVGFPEGADGDKAMAGRLVRMVTMLFNKHVKAGGTKADFVPHSDDVPGEAQEGYLPRMALVLDSEDVPSEWALMAAEQTRAGKVVNSIEIELPIDLYHNRDIAGLKAFMIDKGWSIVSQTLGWTEEEASQMFYDFIIAPLEEKWITS